MVEEVGQLLFFLKRLAIILILVFNDIYKTSLGSIFTLTCIYW